MWLLPLVSLATVIVMSAGAEVTTRVLWPEHTINSCRMADPELGYRYRAGCTAVTKAAEGPWTTNSYNECGYRSAAPCAPVPSGTRRVALIGSSLSEGYMVPYAQTVGASLGQDLTEACHAPVEVQNLGGIGYFGPILASRMAEALRLKPDAILLLLSPFDLEGELETAAPKPGAQAALEAPEGLQHRLFTALKSSRAVLVAQHFLFQNPSVYLPLYLRYGDKADFLRPPFTPNWDARLQTFDALLGDLGHLAHDAHVQLTVGFVPQEAQVALMAGRPIPAGIVPEALPQALDAIAERHGVAFVDTSEALRLQPAPEQLFYQVDGHLSGLGQPVIAAYIAGRLTDVPQDGFSDCHRSASVRVATPG